jgi:hypothetical protein
MYIKNKGGRKDTSYIFHVDAWFGLLLPEGIDSGVDSSIQLLIIL